MAEASPAEVTVWVRGEEGKAGSDRKKRHICSALKISSMNRQKDVFFCRSYVIFHAVACNPEEHFYSFIFNLEISILLSFQISNSLNDCNFKPEKFAIFTSSILFFDVRFGIINFSPTDKTVCPGIFKTGKRQTHGRIIPFLTVLTF